MERKFPVEHFRKFRYTSQGCPLYRKFRKILFHSSLGISKIQLGIFIKLKAPIVTGFRGLILAVAKKNSEIKGAREKVKLLSILE